MNKSADAVEARLPASPDGDEPTATALLDLLRQERADFRNFRRRVAEERSTELDRMRAGLLGLLLPVIDELDRALSAVPGHLADDPWVRGVGLTRSRLEELQRELGVERVGEPGDRFDPTRHEAVIYEPAPDATEATIGQVLRPGYAAGDRLLRPAQVIVRGPRLSEDTAAEPSDGVLPDDEPPGG